MSFAQVQDSAVEQIKITAKGYLLKKCRVKGDVKPWKKRYFVLQGGSLIYYRGENMAGAFKLLQHLNAEAEISRSSETLKQNKSALPIAIKVGKDKTLYIAAESEKDCTRWIEALTKAKTFPPMELPDQTYKYAGSSATLRLKMGLSAALASSSVGRAIVKHYMDDASKELVSSCIELAESLASRNQSKAFEKGIFDIAARISVIWRAAKFPPYLDLSLLYDETTNFTQDLLMYMRDIRLKDKRGPDAEVEPVNMEELMRSSAVIQELWKEILMPHCSKKVLITFDAITGFYFNEKNIWAVLTDKELYKLMCSIEKSLRAVLERY